MVLFHSPLFCSLFLNSKSFPVNPRGKFEILMRLNIATIFFLWTVLRNLCLIQVRLNNLFLCFLVCLWFFKFVLALICIYTIHLNECDFCEVKTLRSSLCLVIGNCSKTVCWIAYPVPHWVTLVPLAKINWTYRTIYKYKD